MAPRSSAGSASSPSLNPALLNNNADRIPVLIVGGGPVGLIMAVDLFGRGFVLLRLGRDAPEADGFIRAADACGLRLEVHAFDMEELSALYGRKLVLVRPDGHVAWRADAPPENPAALFDRVRGMVPPAQSVAISPPRQS